jgi:hypothetical protein
MNTITKLTSLNVPLAGVELKIPPGRFGIRAPRGVTITTDDRTIVLDDGADEQILMTVSGDLLLQPAHVTAELRPIPADAAGDGPTN